MVVLFLTSLRTWSMWPTLTYPGLTSVKPHSILTKSPNGFFGQYFVSSSLNPTILVSFHVVNTLMMKTWTSWKSRGPTSWPLVNIKLVSQGGGAVSVAKVHRNSTLRNNNPQSWCYWLYWSVLMTMAAVLGDVVCLARCSMLRASPDATRCCCWVNVCDVLPGWLPWSLMLPVDQWPTKHNF